MRVETSGTGIEFTVTGTGRPVVLLHGFPDSARLWRHQVPALVAAGFQTIVPDLRGYGRSGKPADPERYAMPHLMGDVLAVLDHLGVERADLVGHDWGAALAWVLASLVPDRVGRLCALSVGHPAAFAAAGQAQREKSWYMLLFQFEEVAERWLSYGGWANLRAWSGHPDADQVIADLERDGSLTPALNWYRANLPPASLLGPPPDLPPVRSPVMGVWGTGDVALTEDQMRASAAHVDGPWRYERLTGPGHWLQLQDPDRVNALLLDFLGPGT